MSAPHREWINDQAERGFAEQLKRGEQEGWAA